MQELLDIDYVPPNVPELSDRCKLVIMEDNAACLKMLKKGRSLVMRHVSRTHRVNLDWLFERLLTDPAVFGRYIHTKLQIADMLTKGHFTSEQWKALCNLIRVGSPPKSHAGKSIK